MTIQIKWRAVFLSLLCFLILLSFTYNYYPNVLPARFKIGRRLMNDESCQELAQQIDYIQSLMKANEQNNLDAQERLRVQNTETRKKLEVQRAIVKDLERRNRQLIEKLSSLENGGPRKREDDYRLAPQISPDVIRTLNIHQRSEFEIIPYDSFNKDRVYQLEMGMQNKPEIAPLGDKKRELDEVFDTALTYLNSNSEGKNYNLFDLAQGYIRTDRTIGTEYELHFRKKGKQNVFQHVQLFRPFAPIQTVQLQTYDKESEWINLIVPLSGRIDSFEIFMDMFTENCIESDKKVFLTIVYFGEEGKEEVKNILHRVASEKHFAHYKLIERTDEFSRGVGLLAGAEAWDQGNVLLFFCDVDVVFQEGFLNRCRLNSAPGARAYYPIVFSLYNPELVYSDLPVIPHWKEQLVLTRDSGFWRTFGFGMTCMYRTDFLFMRGFDTKIQGWGFEDVKLYRKLVQSNLDVVRATDPGIFHVWHEKHCDPHLLPAQYKMCLKSKAIGEASQTQLGMLAFKHLKTENERLHQQFDTMEGDIEEMELDDMLQL